MTWGLKNLGVNTAALHTKPCGFSCLKCLYKTFSSREVVIQKEKKQNTKQGVRNLKKKARTHTHKHTHTNEGKSTSQFNNAGNNRSKHLGNMVQHPSLIPVCQLQIFLWKVLEMGPCRNRALRVVHCGWPDNANGPYNQNDNSLLWQIFSQGQAFFDRKPDHRRKQEKKLNEKLNEKILAIRD